MVERMLALRDKPSIEPDFTEPLTPQDKGLVLTAFTNVKVPMPVDDFYSMIGSSVPQPGDQVINPSTGEIGELGATDEEFSVAQAPPAAPAVPVKLDENNNPIPAMTPEQAHGAPAQARFTLASLDKVMAKATVEELGEVLELVKAAESAPHQNGEVKLLRSHLDKINRRQSYE